MANVINNTASRVKNNPIATIIGGVATYYLLKKQFANAPFLNNKYVFVAVVGLGAIVGATISSNFKQSRL